MPIGKNRQCNSHTSTSMFDFEHWVLTIPLSARFCCCVFVSLDRSRCNASEHLASSATKVSMAISIVCKLFVGRGNMKHTDL